MTEIDHARIARVFAAQRANRLSLKQSSAATRKERLIRLRDEILRRADEIDEALFIDLRKARMGSHNTEILSALGDIATAVEQLDDWMKPEQIEPSPYLAGNKAYVQYEPRGVVMLFGPWNFPFALIFSPLVPIIAAGNACMIKPNELQPHTSRIVAEIISAVFPEEEVAVFEGGIALAEALQALPFDHIFFTGSPAIGKRIMAKAAEHLTSVTLELGGKCPAIIDASFDLVDAVAKIVPGRFLNAGQLCLSVDHVWVPRDRLVPFLDLVRQTIAAMFYSEGQLQKERLPRIVDARNLARIKSYLDEAVELGANIVCGGEIDSADLTVHPTVLSDVPLNTRLMNEEIFGPILPVLVYDKVEDITDHIDLVGKPLAVYVFSNDQAFVTDILDRTSSGGVTVNNVMMHFVESRLPFGGVNSSGMGRYKGIHGFRELSNARSVFVQKT